jgi:hypothetical protein
MALKIGLVDGHALLGHGLLLRAEEDAIDEKVRVTQGQNPFELLNVH